MALLSRTMPLACSLFRPPCSPHLLVASVRLLSSSRVAHRLAIPNDTLSSPLFFSRRSFFSPSIPTLSLTEKNSLSKQLVIFDVPNSEREFLKRILGYYGNHQTRIRKATHLYAEMCQHLESNIFCKLYDTDKLSFQQWFGLAVLHYWICSIGYRQIEEKEARKTMEEVFNCLWNDAEIRILESGIKDLPGKSFILGKQQKLFLKQYMGMMFSYDEGLVFGDNLLAEALWRNLFFMENCSAETLAFFVHYVRQQIHQLDKVLLMKHAHIPWIDLSKYEHTTKCISFYDDVLK